VIRPNTDQKVPFADLSITGGVVNAYAALKLAATINPKKAKVNKIKKG
jgi:hypothetical protein